MISDKDMAILLGRDSSLPLQVDELSQQRDEKGRFVQDPNAQFIDNFLNTLRIPDWNMTQLIGVLLARPEMIENWLRKKGVEDHQVFYALLHDFLGIRWTGSCWYSSNSSLKNRLSDLPIVLCSDNTYRVGGKCFFPSDDVEHDERFPRVTKGVYSSGKDDDQKLKTRGFLEAFKVRPVDEVVEIEAILNLRYEDSDTVIPPKLHEEDMKRFIAFVESNPDKAALFNGYNIFNTSGGNWSTSLIFLDSPYLETGLKVYYEDDAYWEYIQEENVDPYFSLDYEESDIDLKKLGKFAEAVGARTKLEAVQLSTSDHPKADDFRNQGSGYWRNTGIDEDYRIPEFHILLAHPSIVKSKLFWQTMCSLPEHCLKACFCWNASNELQEDFSSLVYELRNEKWVPQENGESVSFVSPREALRDYLPGGFPYDTGQKWFDTIEFGVAGKEKRLENIRKETEENLRNQRAQEFGFGSADEAKNAADFFEKRGISAEESLNKLRTQERRKELLIIDLSDADEKAYEVRAKNIRSTRSTIDPSTALRAQYTADNNKMECQMCLQDMPFKKRNSQGDYFEAVEALGKGYFFKEHEAQYLALCPECAAKYTEVVKKDRKAREACYNAIKDSDDREIRLELNGLRIRIRFEEKHWQDLKTVLYYYENVYDPDEND